MSNTNDIIILLRKLGFKILDVDTKKYIGFKAVKLKEVIEVNSTNIEILNAIKGIKTDIKDLSTKVDNNHNEFKDFRTEMNEFRSEVNNRFDNLVKKNNLVE